MQWVLILVLAVIALSVVGMVIAALKWLIILAALVALVAVAGSWLLRGSTSQRRIDR